MSSRCVFRRVQGYCAVHPCFRKALKSILLVFTVGIAIAGCTQTPEPAPVLIPLTKTMALDAEVFASGNAIGPVPKMVVSYPTKEKKGTIIIDVAQRRLFLVMENEEALAYGIGVAREGFEWSGRSFVSAKREWPDWTPPLEMRQREPDLPRFMEGGVDNPLGARAIYLGGSIYRIHGSNEPFTIGSKISSGCIRLANADVMDLYERVKLGARVVVLPETFQAEKVPAMEEVKSR